jgi:hypothetical protein
VTEEDAKELPEPCSENMIDLNDLQHLLQPRIASRMQGLADTALQSLHCCAGLQAHRAERRREVAGSYNVDGQSRPREGNFGN